MPISGETIRKLGIVQDGVTSSYRPASYDLTIGAIISADGKQIDEYVIPPQGMVKVVSSESIRISASHVGYVLVKTSLCNRGVLSLNIGVVDPGYVGPLSSTLINFGKSRQRIRNGDIFSRMTVHQLNPEAPINVDSKVVTKETALREATSQVDYFLGDTFLDLKATTEKVAEKAFEKYKKTMLLAVPVLALFLAAFTFLLNFANMWVLYSHLKPKDTVRTELVKAEIDRKLDDINASTSALSEEVAKLQRAAAASAKPKGSK